MLSGRMAHSSTALDARAAPDCTPLRRRPHTVDVDWREPAGVDGVESLRVLQTDAFNEACRVPSLDGIVAATRRTVMDISLPILRDAVQHARGRELRLRPCSTDVRRLGLRTETFDGVFSPSTLDHFARTDQIALAPRELRRVVKQGTEMTCYLGLRTWTSRSSPRPSA
jgi:hypothetical protein